MPEQSSERPIIELRSEPVQEIIGKDPNWIIRWGITVVFVTVILLLIGTWVIKYPEIIPARIAITTQNPPVRVMARSSGKIMKFFVEENQKVENDQYLALLENTANYEDILALRDQLKKMEGFLTEPEKFLGEFLPKVVVLGELQVSYSDFLRSFVDYQTFVEEDFNAEKIRGLRNQIDSYRTMNKQLLGQKELLEQELALFKKRYEKNKRLFEQSLISETEFDTVETQYLDKQFSYKGLETNMVNNEIRIDDTNRNILELEQDTRERRRALQLMAQGSYKKLSSEFDRWEQQYVLVSPMAGYVSFFKFWSNNQYVNLGDEVMVIIPDKTEIIGKIYLPQTGSGKVELGQQVNIKFDSYPFREFGMVNGQISTMSLVARENQYLLNVELPGGLHTTYNKDLEFKHNMEGSADIVTKDLRLIERIFNQFRHLFTSKI